MTLEPSRTSSRRLLLATDLSGRCDRALDRAAILATEYSAQLTVVHVFEPDVYAMTRDPRPAASWRQQPDLKRAIAVKQLHQDLGQLDVAFDLILEEGAPADVILRTADALGGEMIVTGVARGETFGRFIFGSTVDHLVRNAKIPVLVVKNRARKPYQDVVIAIDFSQASRMAIDAAAMLFPNANITLLHWYKSMPSSILSPTVASDMARQTALDDYRDFVNGNPDLARLPVFIEQGFFECIIQAYTADKNIDLLVIGSQGKNVLTRAIVGSTAEMVMASAPTDVLVVTPARRS